MEPHDTKGLTIIIPTLNEADNIPILLDTINGLYPAAVKLIVDDGSTDGTRELAGEKGAMVIDHSLTGTKGLTASIANGILNTHTPYFAVIDGDLQHPPDIIGKMYQLMTDNGLKMVVACRARVDDTWPLHRRMISYGADLMGRSRLIATGAARVPDLMSGCFAGETAFIQNTIVNNRSRFVMHGYKVLYDILKLLPSEITIGTVDYVFGSRREGKSKMKSKHIFAFLESVLR
jgi:dolichol-phosphate mannosyltransferase